MKIAKDLIIIFTVSFTYIFLAACNSDDNILDYPIRLEGRITVDNLERAFIISLPSTYRSGIDTLPLVIGLHGTGGNATQFERDYSFSLKAENDGFIAVYPNGVASDGRLGIRTWNAGTCCDYAARENIDDVKFISSLIDKLVDEYRIDRNRIYVTGMSNGGMMCYRLAAEIPDKIAAIAPVSGTMVYTPTSEQKRSVPILHLHSRLDKIVPYDGGTNAMGYHFPAVDSTLTVWANRNDCNPDFEVVENAEFTKKEWLDKSGHPFIVHYATNDGGHSWPGGKKVRPKADEPSIAINANTLIWEFFQQHTLQ